MGKRSNFERNPRDFYRTPLEAVAPIYPFLDDVQTYSEPCAGDGAMIRALNASGLICSSAFDIEPQSIGIDIQDALLLEEHHVDGADVIITNPPWDRAILHPLIERFSDLRPTWLLFDADWMHTKQSRAFLPRLRKIVSIGRVQWFNKTAGKDNACWYLFDKQSPRPNPTRFYGRT
jgi:hypothetical protein